MSAPDIFMLEHRSERGYDEADSGHLVHPNGSLIASFDRSFLGAAGREVLALHGVSTVAA